MKLINKTIKVTVTITAIILSYFYFLPSSIYAETTLTQQEAWEYVAEFSINFYNKYKEECIYSTDEAQRESAYLGKTTSGVTSLGVSFGSKYAFDCVGFVSLVYHNSLGLGDSNSFTYFAVPKGGTNNPRANTDYLDVVLGSVKGDNTLSGTSKLQPGDVIFRTGDETVTQHVMIYVGNGKVIHMAGSGLLYNSLGNEKYAAVARINSSGLSKIISPTTIFNGQGSLTGIVLSGDTSTSGNSSSSSSGNIYTSEPLSGVVSVEEKKPLYKHILLTEKYNFNSIKWLRYGHGYDGVESPMTQNYELGLKYPSDGDNTSLTKFINLVQPFLQTWYIPLSSAATSISQNKESIGDTAGQDAYLPYSMIRFACSDIIVNRYDLEKVILKTKYEEYYRYEYRDEFEVVEKVITKVDVSIKAGEQTTGSQPVITKSVTIDSNITEKQIDDKTIDYVNTRLERENNVENPEKEDFVDSITSIDSSYYISSAKTFDMKFSNSYNYIKYNEDDVKKRINADRESVSSEEIDRYTNEENRFVSNSKIYNDYDINKFVNSNNLHYVSTPISEEETTTEDTNGNTQTITTTKTTRYKVYTNSYFREVGNINYVTRSWSDKLSYQSSSTSYYGVTDLIDFNNSTSTGVSNNQSNGVNNNSSYPKYFSELNFKAAINDYNYYSYLEEKEELNRLDFINSNPEIFLEYIDYGSQSSDYIGIPRSRMEFMYSTLKSLIDKTRNSLGTVPFAYFASLGYSVQTPSSIGINDTTISVSNGFGWPVDLTNNDGARQINCIYGYTPAYGSNHEAIDIAPGSGDNYIIASKAGTIVSIVKGYGVGKKGSTDGGGYGNNIVIEHSNGYYTRYAHLASIDDTLSEGSKVKKGQVLGVMGSSGNSTGTHLDFTIYEGSLSNTVDPLEFFNTSPTYGSILPSTITSLPSGYTFESEKVDMSGIGFLSAKYESSNDPSIAGDWRNFEIGNEVYGKFPNAFGKYQFDRRYALPEFINRLYNSGNEIYQVFEPYLNKDFTNDGMWFDCYEEFYEVWKKLYNDYPEQFEYDQDEYAYEKYYLPLAKELYEYWGLDLESRSTALKACMFSHGIRNGRYYASLEKYLEGATADNTDEEIINVMYANSLKYHTEEQYRYTHEPQDCLQMLYDEIGE